MLQVSLDFTDLEIHDNYVIGRTHADVNVNLEKHLRVLKEIERVIKGPFGFIIDEVNDYTVDLEVMIHLKRDSRIRCGAIVSYRNSTIKKLALAVDLIGKPVRYFDSIQEAVSWVQEKMHQD